MRSLLATSARRFYLKRPWQLVLAIAGISLGVAVYVGVALANDSARRAFELSADTVLGTTTHQLVPLDGYLPQSVYRELVLERGLRRAAPVIEGRVRAAALPQRRLTLLGVDPLQEAAFRGYSGVRAGDGGDIARLIVEPGSVILPEALAARLGIGEGETFELVTGEASLSVEVVGLMRGEDPSASVDAPIVADIATAQELLGFGDSISRVDLILTQEEAQTLEQTAPPGTTLVTAARRDQAFADLSRAFRINLTALSLLALVVGVFLIYATMSFAIVQRRPVFGILRALGVGRRELAGTVLLEAAAIGLLATAVGLALGHVLSRGLTGLVLGTMDDLSYASSVAAVPPSPLIYWQGAALGLLATVAAALGPALDAARTSPGTVMQRAALERRTRRRTRLAALLALPAVLIALVLFRADARNLYTAFAGLFLVLAAGALITPLVTIWQMRLIEPAARRLFGLPGAMAVRGVGASLSRTGVATAALAVAVATVIGIGTMIQSFRASLAEWLDTTLVADFYLTGDDALLSQADLTRLEAVPGVAGLGLLRFVELPADHGPIWIRAVRPGPEGWGLTLISAQPGALDALANNEGVLLAEPLAFRLELETGHAIELPTDSGPRSFPILGLFRDYSADGGTLLMSLSLYRSHWRDRALSGVGVYLQEGVDDSAVRNAIEPLLVDRPGLELSATGDIRRMSLAVFDRTFRITEVLRVLSGAVAFLGMLSALLAIQLERAREIAVLRATGFTPREIGILTFTQTGLLGWAAGVMAMPLGAMLAALLVFEINKRSFGWSMDLLVLPGPLLTGLALAVVSALLAGVYPALAARRDHLAQAMRVD